MPTLTIICKGYYDAQGRRVPCQSYPGGVIGQKEGQKGGETHTYCDDCARKAREG